MTSNEFKLSVGLDISTKDAQQQMREFKKQVETSTEIHLEGYDRAFRTITTYVNEAGQSFKTLKTAAMDANGSLVNLEERITRTSENFNKMGTAVHTVSTSTSKFIDDTGATVTQIDKLDASGDRIITTIREYTNAIGANIKETEVYNQTQQTMISSNREAILDSTKQAQSTQQIATNTKKLTQASKEATSANKELSASSKQVAQTNATVGQSFADVVGKVAKFYLATVPIQMFRQALSGSVEAVKEFDSAMTEFKKVSDLSENQLKSYTNTLTEFGEEVARTTTEMIQAATEFKKAGYSAEDSAELARIAALYQNTADEELSASEATSVLVSQLKAFEDQGLEAIHVTDAINQVSQDFAVSSGDIGRGLTQAGAALSTYGNSFEQTIGLVTAGTTIFQGKSQQVARGLNTVASRIAKNSDALAQYGVDVKDSNGQLRSTYDILVDLSPAWKKMSNAEKVALGTTLAGVNQYKVFSAVMTQMDTAIEATNEALNSSGATMRQNAVYMESIEAKTQRLKQGFESLVIGDGGLINIAKLFLDLANILMKLANTYFGKFVIGTTLLSVGIMAVKTAVDQATASFIKFTASMVTNPIFLLIAAVSAVTVAFLTLDKVLDPSTKLKAKQEELQEVAQEYEEIKNQLKSIEDRLKDIGNRKLSVTDTNQLKLLLEEEQSLKRQYILLQQQEKLKKAEQSDKAAESLTQDTEYMSVTFTPIEGGRGRKYNVQSGDRVTALKSELQVLKTLDTEQALLEIRQKELVKSSKTLSDGTKEVENSSTEVGKEYAANAQRIAELEEQSKEYKKSLTEESIALSNEASKLDISKTEYANLKNEVDGAVNSVKNYINAKEGISEDDEELSNLEKILTDVTGTYEEQQQQLEELSTQHEYTIDELEQIADLMIDEGLSAEEAAQKIAEMNLSVGEVNDRLDALQDALKKAQKAQSEYAQYGKINLDTFQDLIAVNADYLFELEKQNGQIDINKATLDGYVNTLKEAKIAEIEEAAAKQIIDYWTKKQQESTSDATSEAESFKEQTDKVTTALVQEAVAQELVNKGFDGLTEDMLADEGVQKILKVTTEMVTQLHEAVVTTDDLSKKTGSASKEAENLAKQYEKAASYIEKMFTTEINRIKEIRDAKIKAVEEEIDALKEEKEAREKYWDDLIDKLKTENQEREKANELAEKQEALEKARAQKVKVLRDGEWTYESDQNAVSSAQKALDDYKQKKAYEDQLAELQRLKKAEIDSYDERIKKLEKYKNEIKKNYEEQITIIEKHKEEYKKSVEGYQESQDKLLAAQLLGIDQQKLNFDTMYKNLAEFVKNYNAKVNELKTVGDTTATSTGANALSTGSNYVGAYASGNSSVGDYETAVVGENPKYRELVIGSKLNNDQGLVMNLKRGSGVVNAEKTNTLASIFNSLSSNSFGRSIGSLKGDSNVTSYSISIGNISLPSVSNAEAFVEYLQNFNMDMVQASYS